VKAEEVTEQILGAWDEIVAEDEPAQETTDEVEGAEVGEPEQESAEEPETEEEGDEEETEEESDEPEEEEVEEEEVGEGDDGDEPEVGDEPEFATDDPEIKAFLAKFQGDVEKALRYNLQAQRALSTQNDEKRLLARRVSELETQLAETTAFSPGGVLLNEEQRTWVGEALESGSPVLYVREAVKAQEFDLARAVCSAWGEHAPYEALRAAQLIDYAEASTSTSQEAVEPEPLDHNELLRVLSDHFPDLPNYASQMTAAMEHLGEGHPLVVDARSHDPEQAVRGVVGIYEIARASERSTSSAREEIQNGAREKAKSARKRAVVSSTGASPSPGETPRSVRLGPGLTLDQLDEEWARNS
jgi:hypothetical protein